jgi:hypothetical protein
MILPSQFLSLIFVVLIIRPLVIIPYGKDRLPIERLSWVAGVTCPGRT